MLASIRQRLILLVLLVALPLVLATSLVIYYFAETQLAAQRQGILASTRTLAVAVDSEIEIYVAIGQALATSGSLQTGELAEFHRHASEAMRSLTHSWLLLVDRNGQQVVNTSRPFGEPLPHIVTPELHQRTMSTGQVQVSDIFEGALARRPIASVHVPVIRDGQAIYNLIVTLDPKIFERLLREQQVPTGWLSGIIDRQGKYIARSRDHERLVGTEASVGWRTAARASNAGESEHASLEGEPLYSAFINSPLSGWSVSIAAHQDVLTAPLRRSLWIMSLIASALIVLSIALAGWASSRISRPMQALEQAAGALLVGAPAHVRRTGLKEIDRALDAFEVSTNALLERESQFRTLANSIPQLAWMADANGRIFWYNHRWFDYTGTTLEEMQGWSWQKVHDPEHLDRVMVRLKHSFETGEPWEDTFPLRGKDNEYRWFLSRALPIRDASGRVVRWFGTNTDVSEQKQTEDRQRLLLNELNHRVKNTLAVIQSIAAVTSRSATSAAAFSKTFISRLLGIARTHDLLTASHWEGAALNDVLLNELSPYRTEGAQRVTLRGEYVRLTPKAAVSLGMVLHEMATNAAKYGALSVPEGRLEVSWQVRGTDGDSMLHLEWKETGGPEVAMPSHQGFGSRLIRESMSRDLGGSAKIDYNREGLRCLFEIPLADTGEAAAAA